MTVEVGACLAQLWHHTFVYKGHFKSMQLHVLLYLSMTKTQIYIAA